MSDKNKNNSTKGENVTDKTEGKKGRPAKATDANKEIVAISLYKSEIFQIETLRYGESVRTGYDIDRSAFIRKALIEGLKLINGAPPPAKPEGLKDTEGDKPANGATVKPGTEVRPA